MAQSGATGYAKVVKRAWTDAAFKRRLLADPVAALAEMGARVSAGMTVRVVENTNQLINLILPLPPAETGLSDEALERAVAEALPAPDPDLGPTINIHWVGGPYC
jgi:hypothetical protein